MTKTKKSDKEKTFENIKHIDEFGNEYWKARDLQIVLEYVQWRRFNEVINKAKNACKNSDNEIFEHFAEVGKLSRRANSAIVTIKDYHLSRYACYLIVQNGDSRKEVIALGQTYFAMQTRRQEISENEKRFYHRKLMKKKNKILNEVAKNKGVKNFDQFHNAGYRGLYNGESADDIFKRKGLRYREDILDNMGSSELIVNLFRIDQTEQKIVKDTIQGEKNAKMAHYEVGKNVREVIVKNGGTLPEELPTPRKSLKELEKEKRKKKIK